MNSFMIFQLELESGEWQTFPLDVQWTQTEWRKDGKGFHYFVPGVNGLSPGGAGIVEKDVKTDDKRYIYHADVGANSFFWPLALRCSRDYTKMAFCEMVGKKIEVINIQSGEKLNEFPRVNESISHPAWSPDGTSIMVNGGKGTALHVLSLAEGSRKEYDLSKNLPEGEIRSFDWSPDGCQVAFCFRFSQFDTYLIRDVIPETKR
jgi:hypothetical protein